MDETSLGQRLRELRDRADLSVRELAKRIGISSPFLSDVELGRRFPSEEILGKLAAVLNVPLEDLKKYDNRAPIADPKRLKDSDPKLGVAFRTAVEKLKSGELTADDLIAPHPIDRFVEHFSDVKLVMYNHHLRSFLCCCRRKAGTHIHGRRLNVLTLRLGQALP
jgi:transcriptional regulator with XRE-family HTH domain